MKAIMLLLLFCVYMPFLDAQSWQTTGNSGLSNNHFIGTTDNIPLLFKVNNNVAGFTGYDQNLNVSFGIWALSNRSSGSENAAYGVNTLYALTTGGENTAIGHNSLYQTTTGSQNTAVGSYTLLNNTTGLRNVAIGSAALYGSTDADYNVAIGNNALRSITTKNNGDEACYNVAVGFNAMQHNSTGNFNTGIGYQSLLGNTTGYWNTGIGAGVLQNNTSGFFNTAVGVSALHYNTTGEQNTALGEESMAGLGANSQTGSYNTAVGLRSLDSNNTGSNNTAIGYRALDRNKTGNNNTAIGLYTDVLSTDLGNVSLLGYRSRSGGNNASAVGSGAVVIADNQIRLGNSSITQIGGFTNWSSPSDSRLDKDVKEDIPGITFIQKLKPVSYTVDIDAADDQEQGSSKLQYNGIEVSERSEKKKKRISGFLAQDVANAADSVSYDFSAIVKPANNNSIYALEYATFVVPLVKSVQELNTKVEQQDSTIKSLQEQIDELRTLVSNASSSVSLGSPGNQNIGLGQNAPNPFSSNTNITYTLPNSFTSAYITINDINGTVFKQIDLSDMGAGSYQLDGSHLMPGVYFYSLVIDGKKRDSKKMIIAR